MVGLDSDTKAQIYRLLGLARRAGRLIAGDRACRRGLEQQPQALIILASDAGRALRRRFSYSASEQARGRSLDCFTKVELGGLFGREEQGVLLLTEPGLIAGIEELWLPRDH